MSTQTIAPQYTTNREERATFFSVYAKLNKKFINNKNRLMHEVYCMNKYENLSPKKISKILYAYRLNIYPKQIYRYISYVEKQLKGGDKS